MKLILGLFLIFEMVVIALKGISITSIIIVMGPGLVIVFSFALYYFIENIKKSFLYSKFTGKALMVSGICFAYGCFAFLYIMYYIFELPDTPYIFLVYFTITIIYSTLISSGLVFESKRKRKLEELLHTRKELTKFFAEETTTAPARKPSGQLGLN